MRVHDEKTIFLLKELRKRGYTIGELMVALSLPKTTIWHHIKRVKILPEYFDEWNSKRGGSIRRFKAEWEKARMEAAKIIESLDRTNRIVIAAALYWAEGSKKDLSLINTDPQLIRVFIECLKEIGVEKDQIIANIRVYEDLDIQKVRKFWEEITGIPDKNIKYFNVLRGRKNGKFPNGMCRLRVRKPRHILKLVHALREAIVKNILPS